MKESSATGKFHRLVERATAEFPETGGRGVLVGGHLILTAAVCLDFAIGGTLALGGHLIQEIQTQAGKNLKVQILAVDLVSDCAVLGSADGQEFDKESAEFDEYCRATAPVPVCLKDHRRFADFPVDIWTRQGIWVQGKGTLNDPNSRRIAIQSEFPIRGGSCGSAIVNKMGELIAVVSSSDSRGTKIGQESIGLNPFISRALPLWAIQKIREHANRQLRQTERPFLLK